MMLIPKAKEMGRTRATEAAVGAALLASCSPVANGKAMIHKVAIEGPKKRERSEFHCKKI